MNDVYENNMRFLPLLKFIEKYKKILTFIAITIILAITFLIISNQVAKKNNLEAASIYTIFLEELSSINPDDSELNNILDNLFLNLSLIHI